MLIDCGGGILKQRSHDGLILSIWCLHVLTDLNTVLVVSLFFAESKFRIAAPSLAAPKSGRAFLAVVPYIVIFVLTWMFYKFLLDTDLNEFTANP